MEPKKELRPLPAAVAVEQARCGCNKAFFLSNKHAQAVEVRENQPPTLHGLPWFSVLRKDKKLSVKIPAGVDEGDRIRLSGEGEAGAW